VHEPLSNCTDHKSLKHYGVRDSLNENGHDYQSEEDCATTVHLVGQVAALDQIVTPGSRPMSTHTELLTGTASSWCSH
jgi:hypothetical protein